MVEVLSDLQRAKAVAAGLDPDNAFVRAAMAEGYDPAPIAAPKPSARALCPVESDIAYPGIAPAIPEGHDCRSMQDRVEYHLESLYPFPDMAVGDSFMLHHTLNPYNVRSAAHYYGRVNGLRFQFRRGRCWRTF